MGSAQIGDDRISTFADGVRGHILSFLPAQEAARAAALSTRWRDVFASVHTVSFQEPEAPIPSYDRDCYSPGYGPPMDPNPPLPFTSSVTAALLARNHRVPLRALRALRVDMENYCGGDSCTVDNWVSYALKQAGAQLEIDLRLRRAPICQRSYFLRAGGGSAVAVRLGEDIVGEHGDDDFFDGNDDDREATSEEYVDDENSPGVWEDGVSNADSVDADDSAANDVTEAMTDGKYDDYAASAGDHVSEAVTDAGYDDSDDSAADDVSTITTDGEYDDVVSSEYEKVRYVPRWELPLPEYSVPRGLFSCAALRSLRIGPCRLSPPATVRLPSLEELLLTRVSDDGQHMQRLISACPRLADLTLEACDTVITLSLLHTRLRRLALRCCHSLAGVALDSSELQAFEYHGTVPDDSFLTMRGASRSSSLTSCKVDICGEEVWSSEELTKLREFLQQFVKTKHLHLQSARLGSGFHKDTFISFHEFSNLRHLEMMGCLPHDDASIVSAMSRILQHAPELEVLTLVFQPEPGPSEDDYERLPGGQYGCEEREFLHVHHLQYNQHNDLDTPIASSMIACLTGRVREINLVHYQGCRAQRTLAKFLLCNALVLDELYCAFAPGPLWIQAKLRREIEGWAMNKPESRIFC